MNTIERHNEQVNNALTFLAKTGFTSAKQLQMVAGRDRRGFPTQLKKLGLVLSKKTLGQQHIFGLSKAGADLIGARQFDIHKVGLSRFEHGLIAQTETLNSIEKYRITNYEFEPQRFLRDTRPDVIWETDIGTIYVEIELSAKSLADGDMDRFFLKLTSRRTVVVFRDPDLADRYLEHARKYVKNGIPNWQKLEGVWIKFNDFIPVPSEAWGRIIFKMHNEPMKHNLSEMIG